MTDPNLPPVTPSSAQQPATPTAYEPAAAPAYQQQAPYGQQPYGAPTEKYNVLAIVSLVTGILFISLVAIITGHISLSQINKSQEKGRGLAIAGLVLGYAGILMSILLFFFVFVPLFVIVANDPSVLNG